MATHCYILAWRIPWQRSLGATVLGVAAEESDTTKHKHMRRIMRRLINLLSKAKESVSLSICLNHWSMKNDLSPNKPAKRPHEDRRRQRGQRGTDRVNWCCFQQETTIRNLICGERINHRIIKCKWSGIHSGSSCTLAFTLSSQILILIFNFHFPTSKFKIVFKYTQTPKI